MNRKKCKGMIGILAVCAAVLCGMLLMRWMLEQRQEMLLSKSGTIFAENSSEGKKDESSSQTKLSLDELKGILNCLEYGTWEEPREPSGNQLPMKEAIAKGQQWIGVFFREYLDGILETPKNYKKVSATLCEKYFDTEGVVRSRSVDAQSAEDDILSEECMGYWKIVYYVQNVEMELWLNAVTGQVLRIKVTSYVPNVDFTSLDMEEILNSYADSFSLRGKYSISKDVMEKGGTSMILCFEEKELYAILDTNRILLNSSEDAEEAEFCINTLELYLSTDDQQFTTTTQVQSR